MRFVIVVLALTACSSKSAEQPDAGTGVDANGDSCSSGGSACSSGGMPEICSDGACITCNDPTDDAACQAAYGTGTLCIQGSCVAATCRVSTDCAGGVACVDNQCMNCMADSDCASGQICNTGTCSDALAACSAQTESAACGSGDLCCPRTAGLECEHVQCCQTSDCGVNELCAGGACVPSSSGCAAPTTPAYFVDATFAGPSTGSMTCPWKSLHDAFNAVRTDNFTGDSTVTIIAGTFDSTVETFPLVVPASVFVTIPALHLDPTIEPPANTTAFIVPFSAEAGATSGWSARLSDLEIKQATQGTGNGILATGGTAAAPVQIDDVDITNFYHGINVEGGVTHVADAVRSLDNGFSGVRVGGGTANVTLSASANAASVFTGNIVGIYVTNDPNSILIAAGSPQNLLHCDGNSNSGIRVESPNPANSISYVAAESNSTNGLGLYGGASVKVRNSTFVNNTLSGVRVVAGTSESMTGMDLGTAADPGNNVFSANTQAEVCVDLDTPTGTLLLAGNTWDALSCASGGSVPNEHLCKTANKGFGSTGLPPAVDVSQCTLPPLE
jgi:hypothetical protein